VRLGIHDIVRARLSEDEHETLIQLCHYFLYLGKALRDTKLRVPGEDIKTDEGQVDEHSGPQDTGSCMMEDPNGDGSDDGRVE
jgi:hypothetical protein